MAPRELKILIKDLRDPMAVLSHHQTGLINIIDLANIDSCSFIATDDLGFTIDETADKIMAVSSDSGRTLFSNIDFT